MKKFRLEYGMKIFFSREVFNHHFSLRCMPKSEARQKAKGVKIRLNADYFACGGDGFGNRFIYGYKKEKHDVLDLYLKTEVAVDWQKYDTDSRLNSVFLLPTAATAAGENLDAFYRGCAEKCAGFASDYERAVYVMKEVRRRMSYEKNVTNVKTSAEEAFSAGRGVCQDFAQIMIALLRKMKIPARYAAGVMEGETLTHAWAECYANNRWYGFDPTNDLLVNDSYIVFSRGRDCGDCLVNKGVFFGPAVEQKQDIFVRVSPIENSGQHYIGFT